MAPYLFPIFSAQVLPGGVGYMRLRSFVNPWTPLQDGKTVVQELDDALNSFEAAGVSEWLLDLRGNLGGVTSTAQAFAGRFPSRVQHAWPGSYAIVDGAALSLADGLALEAQHFGALVDSADFREGSRAFLDKRKPAFSGA